MANPIITTAGFCAGVGWLDLGVALGLEHFGFIARPAFMCEWESYAAAVLKQRMEEKALERCPIWCGDMADFDCRPWIGEVDMFVAGLPCQPYSCAGKQLGLADQRSYGDGDGPLPHFLRIVGECRPALVFLENVPAWITGGWFQPFGEELSGMGYEIEDPLFIAASDVGANHLRERVFVLAHRAVSRGWRLSESSGRHDSTDVVQSGEQLAITSRGGFGELRESSERDGLTDGGDEVLVHAKHGTSGNGVAGKQTGPESRKRGGMQRPTDAGGVLGDSGRARADAGPAGCGSRDSIGESSRQLGDTGCDSSAERQRRLQRQAIESERGMPVDSELRRAELGHAERSGPQGNGFAKSQRRNIAGASDTDGRIFAPGPSADWRGIPEHLWPAVEPGFRVLVDGCPVVVDESRADQLRCSGNGCVVLQSAVAFVHLMRIAGLVK